MRKRFEGHDETIVDPQIQIIDSHHHLFDRPGITYLLGDYLQDVNLGHDIKASVYVETLAMARPDGPPALRPLGEVEFANGAAASSASGLYGACRVAAAIVGFADLSLGDEIGELLDRSLASAPERFRGVRQLTMDHPDPGTWRYVTNPPPSGLLKHPGFRRGFAQVAARGLTFDAAIFHHQAAELSALADAFPTTTIVLNHMAHPMCLDVSERERLETFSSWRRSLRLLAQRPNVVCKVGGLGLPFWGFGFEHRTEPVHSSEAARVWRPYVEAAIETFGADRCMLESNFPADGRSLGFVPTWNALKLIVNGVSAAEEAALFRVTAAKVYGLESFV